METKIQRIRVPFTKEEDEKLTNLIKMYGENNWELISTLMQTGRTPRQCRDRWVNWINVSFVKEVWSPAEDSRLLAKFEEIGPHWKAMEPFFPGRVSYTLRNRFSKLQKMNKTSFPPMNKEESSTQLSPPASTSNNNTKKQDGCDLICKGKSSCSDDQSKSEKCSSSCTYCSKSCNSTQCKKTENVCQKKVGVFDNIKDNDDQGFDWSENSWCRCICPSNIK